MSLLDDAEFRIDARLILAEEAIRDTSFNCPKGCGVVRWEFHRNNPVCVVCGKDVSELIPSAQVDYLRKFPIPVSDP